MESSCEKSASSLRVQGQLERMSLRTDHFQQGYGQVPLASIFIMYHRVPNPDVASLHVWDFGLCNSKPTDRSCGHLSHGVQGTCGLS